MGIHLVLNTFVSDNNSLLETEVPEHTKWADSSFPLFLESDSYGVPVNYGILKRERCGLGLPQRCNFRYFVVLRIASLNDIFKFGTWR